MFRVVDSRRVRRRCLQNNQEGREQKKEHDREKKKRGKKRKKEKKKKTQTYRYSSHFLFLAREEHQKILPILLPMTDHRPKRFTPPPTHSSSNTFLILDRLPTEANKSFPSLQPINKPIDLVFSFTFPSSKQYRSLFVSSLSLSTNARRHIDLTIIVKENLVESMIVFIRFIIR